MVRRWVCVAGLAACGDSGGSGVDAQPDGLPDAPGPAVELTVVLSTGAPLEGLRVLFNASDATLVADVRTDAAGHASARIDTGGSVSLVDAPALLVDASVAFREIRHVGGITAGEQLTLALPPPRDPNTSSFDVIIPADTGAGVFGYRVTSRCDARATLIPQTTASTYTVTVTKACAGDNDILVASIDSMYRAVRTFYRPSVAVTNGAVFDFSTATYQAPEQIAFAITNEGIPAYLERFTANDTYLFPNSYTYVQSSTGWTQTFDLPQAPVVREVLSAGFLDGSKTQWGPANLTRSVDGAFPRLTRIASTAYDSATRTLNWTEGTSGLTPDAMIAMFVYTGSTTLNAWHVFVPYGLFAFRFPQLPADLAQFEPDPGTVAPRIYYIAGSMGFDELRRNIDAVRLLAHGYRYEALFTTDVLGTEGTLARAGSL